MKKLLAITITLLMLLPVTANAMAGYTIGDSETVFPLATDSAEILHELNLFRGTDNGYELSREVTRAEAVAMVLRVTGSETAALATEPPGRFTDVPDGHWAQRYISYGAENGILHGTSETTFAPDRGVTGQEFVKMLLGALGYTEVTLERAYEKGVGCGLLINNPAKLAVETDGYRLIRSDVVNLCHCALLAKTADGQMLQDLLVDKGLFTKEELNRVLTSETPPAPVMDGALTLSKQIADQLDKDENYMFSPLSIKLAFAMAANGAEGETQQEILDVMGIADLTEFNQAASALMERLNGSEDVQFKVANSIWLNTDYFKGSKVAFLPSYRDTIERYYKGKADEVTAQNAVKTINDWISQQTNGKIKDVMSSSDFLAALVNTVYFKGEWANQFNERATEKGEFTDGTGKKTQIDFMHDTGYYAYAEIGDMQLIALPYKNRDTAMYILLPEEGKRASLDALSKDVFANMESAYVRLSLPKWKTENKYELNSLLKQLGIETAFDRTKAQFTNKMFQNLSENAFISDVIHQTFIDVNENGTEAAAATAISVGATSALPPTPVEFNADHPFAYFIRDEVSGEILFFGEYLFGEESSAN